MDTTNFKRFAELEQKKKDLEDELAHVKGLLKEYEAQILEVFQDEGIKSFKVSVKTDSGHTIDRTLYHHRQLWAGYQPGENGNGKATLTEALEKEGLSELVTKGFNTQKLSKFVREYDEGGDSPEEIIAKLPDSLQDKLKISEVNQIKTRSS